MRAHSRSSLLGILFAVMMLCAGRAAADPVPVNIFLDGQLRGCCSQEQLDITFPGFRVSLDQVTHLKPGFCEDQCGTGTEIPFTQTTGVFSGHVGGFGSEPDADVTGNFSFVGPTDVVTLDQFGGFFVSEPVRFSGVLKVVQGPHVLFRGMLRGSGLADIVIENVGVAGPRLGGYEYRIQGVAETPEPASIVLFGTGGVWLATRRRRANPRQPAPSQDS
jgi:hypothetical protein